MKYTYQDSTELPVQRDFIQDLQTFVDVTQKVIPLEKSAIETNYETETKINSLKKRIDELENFEKSVRDHVEKLANSTKSEEIIECKNKVMDVSASTCREKSQYLEEEIKSQKKQCEQEIERIESQVYPALDPLFKGGVYGSQNKYTGFMDGVLQGKLIANLDGMQYESELTFKHKSLNVRGIYGDLSIPVWSTSGLIHKEKRIKNADVSDFILNSFKYDGGYLDAVFTDRKQEHNFRLIVDNNLYHVYCGDYEITEDNTLYKSLNMGEIESFTDMLIDYIHTNITTQKLKKLFHDDKDAVKNNEIFDCLKIIAQQYSSIINECLERGYVKNEITIKIQKSDGTRTEKYINKNEVFSQLSDLGSEGLELAEILGVRNQDSDSLSET